MLVRSSSSQHNTPRMKGGARSPGNPSLSAILVQIRKILPTTRTGRSLLHLRQPVNDTFPMKRVRALVARPNDRLTDLIVTQANGTAVGYSGRFPVFQTEAQRASRSLNIVRSRLLCLVRGNQICLFDGLR